MSEKRWIRVAEIQVGDRIELARGRDNSYVAEVQSVVEKSKTMLVTLDVSSVPIIRIHRYLRKSHEIEVEREAWDDDTA